MNNKLTNKIEIPKETEKRHLKLYTDPYLPLVVTPGYGQNNRRAEEQNTSSRDEVLKENQRSDRKE